MDSSFDPEMQKLTNWLLFGMSTTDICGALPGFCYEDSFFVISKDGFQGFTNSAGFKEFSKLNTLIQNLNVYTITKSDENDSEKQEVIKVARFYEMVHDKKIIGMPVRKIVPGEDVITSEMNLVEKWPMIQAYGLDMVGGGFFTMKHSWKNLRDDLDVIYKEYDSFAKYRMVNEEVERLNLFFFDNFFAFNRDTATKRQQRTEQELIDALWLRYEFGLVQKKKVGFQGEDDHLPVPRVLFGANTNKGYKELSDS